MKKVFAMLMALTMLVGCMTGCGNSSSSGNTDAPADETVVLKMGITAPANTPMANNSNVLKERLEEISGGKMTIDLHIAGALGSTAQHYAQMKEGSLDLFLTAFDTASALKNGSDFAVLSVPYLFDDIDHYMRFVESDIFSGMLDKVEGENGLRFAGVSGKLFPRALSTTNKPVASVADVENLKVRTSESPAVVEMWEAWGANPVIISGGELYSGLESGMADGQENDIASTFDSALGEVQSYYMEINYIQQCNVIWMSQKTWDSFSDQQKAWFDQAMKETLEEYSGQISGRYDEVKQGLKDQGVQFIDVDVDSFKEVAYEAVESMEGDLFSEGLFDSIRDLAK